MSSKQHLLFTGIRVPGKPSGQTPSEECERPFCNMLFNLTTQTKCHPKAATLKVTQQVPEQSAADRPSLPQRKRPLGGDKALWMSLGWGARWATHFRAGRWGHCPAPPAGAPGIVFKPGQKAGPSGDANTEVQSLLWACAYIFCLWFPPNPLPTSHPFQQKMAGRSIFRTQRSPGFKRSLFQHPLEMAEHRGTASRRANAIPKYC